ncbi:MAG: hypothetical protein NC048_05085 [Bacteroides sp.]|nr:hypothetical protein [Bacteroides sp.]
MTLFVFEGKRDSKIFDTLLNLFFEGRKDSSICIYRSDIYDLYRKLEAYDTFGHTSHDGNTLAVLKDILKERNDTSLENVQDADISDIYLFFDYDFQQKTGTLRENNERVRKMLAYFDDETGNGKLYIHYPMLESICYTKELPDTDYSRYVVERSACRGFKRSAREFSFYKSLDYIELPDRCLKGNADCPSERMDNVQQNWSHLVRMNVGKAHYLCQGSEKFPVDKRLIAQADIYTNQLRKYVEKQPCQVSVLNSFPLFLYEYFKEGKFEQ